MPLSSKGDRLQRRGARGAGYTSLAAPCYSWAVPPRGLIACAAFALGCRSSREPIGFGSNSSVASTLEGTSGEGSTAEPPSASSSSTTGLDQGTSSGSTGLRLDLGREPDLEPPQPAGCKGKIDFLFVISTGGF